MRCRLCQGKTKKLLNLGKTPPPEEFRTKAQLNNPLHLYPLGLSYCLECGHVQLNSKIPSDIIYKQNYFYDYSVTKTGLKHWTNLANLLSKRYNLSSSDLVVDIGSNTGALLAIFKNKTRILGIDPANKLTKIAKQKGIPTKESYFSLKIAKNIVEEIGQAKVITCTNTFDHVDDLDEFMQGVSFLLKDEGIFIIEVPYFLKMLKDLTHVVYHQQIDYMMLQPLIPFFQKYNLKISDAQQIPLHGSSIRMWVSFQGRQTKRFANLEKHEKILYQNWDKTLFNFARIVQKQRQDLINILKSLKNQGKTIAAVGASAKGITLLNYCGLDLHTIDFITEKSSLKIGRFTASGIPVVSDHELLRKKPDYALLLAWNFQNEILDNLKEYQKLGGKFIIPIPKIELK